MEISTESLSFRVRLALDQTQEAFARTMSVSKTSIQNWESMRGKPQPDRLRRMAELAPRFARELRSAAEKLELEIRERRRGAGRRSSGRKLGFVSIKVASRRYAEDTIVAAHEALDLVLDNAHSGIVKKVQTLLDKHAAQWRDRDES